MPSSDAGKDTPTSIAPIVFVLRAGRLPRGQALLIALSAAAISAWRLSIWSPIGAPLNRRCSKATQTTAVKMRKPTVIHRAQSFGGCTPMKKMSSAEWIDSTANSLKIGPPRSYGPIFVHA